MDEEPRIIWDPKWAAKMNPPPPKEVKVKGKSGTRNARIEQARWREKQILELRMAGYDYESIAQQVGLKTASSAYCAWKRAIDRIPQQAVEDLRKLENERLDKLQRAVWGKVIEERDKKGIALILKVMQRRAAMNGIDLSRPMSNEDMVTTVAAITAALDQAEQHNDSDQEEDSQTTPTADPEGMPE